MNRFGYGGTPQQRERYSTLGAIEWVMEQIAEVPNLAIWPASESPAMLQGDNGTIDDAQRETVKVMLKRCVSDTQSLAAVLRDFWFNHFNVYAKMGIQKHQLHDYLNTCITPNMTGSFQDMLFLTAKHPAMMHYLDNKKNHYQFTSAYIGTNRFSVGPNQNYAREVMELHTMGVDSGYTQQDIRELTRLLSGFSSNFESQLDNDYEWRPDWHDPGPKTILGHTVQPTGETELQTMAEILTNQDQTAVHVGGKLVRRFVGENANQASLETVAHAFSSSNGDLQVVMETLALLPQMHDPAIFRTRLKPPHRFVASAFRTLGLEPSPWRIDNLVKELLLLGDTPFFYGPPTGFPDVFAFWLTGDGMLSRAQIALKISQDPAVQDAIPVASTDAAIVVDAVLAHILPAGAEGNTREVMIDKLSRVRKQHLRKRMAIEMALSSPEFMRY